MLWSLLIVMPLMFLFIFGCGTGEITTSPSVSTSPSVTLPPGTDLAFGTVTYSGNLGGTYEGKSAQIRVISDIQEPLPEALNWVKPSHRDVILEVDYSKYFVIVVFNGYRSGIHRDLNVQKIWQDENEVFVLAHFNDFIPGATSLPAFNSQYQVVKIDRTLIMHPEIITFRLLDEAGGERATTTCEITTDTDGIADTTLPHDNELYFEELWVAHRPTYIAEPGTPPYIFVITHTQSPLPDRWEYYTVDPQREKLINIEDVDFSKYFMLVVSMGFQSVTGPKITVESIWQVGDVIYTQANFDMDGPTYQPTFSEPARSVRVSTENMTQFGEITFILLDQEGEERARTTCEIPE